MTEHRADVTWERGEQAFTDLAYSRRHRLSFDGGAEVPGSASPHVVPPPASDPAAVDPEELFLASLASCHMLWFLDLAARRGYRIDRYQDTAQGVLSRDAGGRLALTTVTLRPHVTFSGEARPDWPTLLDLHHAAHEACFIANSVRSEVRCEPRAEAG